MATICSPPWAQLMHEENPGDMRQARGSTYVGTEMASW
jgi:hypothetical protein